MVTKKVTKKTEKKPAIKIPAAVYDEFESKEVEAPKPKVPLHLCDTCGKMFSFTGENSEQKPKCTVSGSVISDKILACSQYVK